MCLSKLTEKKKQCKQYEHCRIPTFVNYANPNHEVFTDCHGRKVSEDAV